MSEDWRRRIAAVLGAICLFGILPVVGEMNLVGLTILCTLGGSALLAVALLGDVNI